LLGLLCDVNIGDLRIFLFYGTVAFTPLSGGLSLLWEKSSRSFFAREEGRECVEAAGIILASLYLFLLPSDGFNLAFTGCFVSVPFCFCCSTFVSVGWRGGRRFVGK